MKLMAGCGVTVGNAAFTIFKIIPQKQMTFLCNDSNIKSSVISK